MTTDATYAAFGLTRDEVAVRAAEYESDDWSGMKFGEAIEGLPEVKEELETYVSFKVKPSRLKAMNRAAAQMGISRSEFVRRAVENELLALSS